MLPVVSVSSNVVGDLLHIVRVIHLQTRLVIEEVDDRGLSSFDLAVMYESIKQCRAHLVIDKHFAPLREVQIGCDQDANVLIDRDIPNWADKCRRRDKAVLRWRHAVGALDGDKWVAQSGVRYYPRSLFPSLGTADAGNPKTRSKAHVNAIA